MKLEIERTEDCWIKAYTEEEDKREIESKVSLNLEDDFYHVWEDFNEDENGRYLAFSPDVSSILEDFFKLLKNDSQTALNALKEKYNVYVISNIEELEEAIADFNAWKEEEEEKMTIETFKERFWVRN